MQWISGQVMVIVPDGAVLAPSGAGAVGIDLSQVDQDEYQGLVTGDPVLVTGMVPNERSRIIATSVQRLAS